MVMDRADLSLLRAVEITASSSDVLELPRTESFHAASKVEQTPKGLRDRRIRECFYSLVADVLWHAAIGLNVGRNLQVTQVSRDIAVMYSCGVETR
jgi:hypothetical protein